MGNKLIIVEGLPGSGKSTAAKIAFDILKEKGIDAELYSEGNYNHPADFDGAAYFSNEEFESMGQTYFESRQILNKIKVEYYEGYLIPYRKAIEEQKISFDEELFKAITKNDIYELPLELHKQLILKRWSEFASDYISKDKVAIFECCFIQNPVTVSMIKNDSLKADTMNYIKSLEEKITPLKPVLIYVEQNDIKASFIKAVRERPKEWLDGFTDYYTSQGYGLQNNLRGLDGVIKILEARSKLEKDIYNSLEIAKYKIDNSEFNIDFLKEKAGDIIMGNQ